MIFTVRNVEKVQNGMKTYMYFFKLQDIQKFIKQTFLDFSLLYISQCSFQFLLELGPTFFVELDQAE